MPRFPVDAPKNRVVRALEQLGYRPIRERNHICMARENPNGSRSVLVLPNHRRIKGSTLRRICTQAGISRDAFLEAYKLV
jgi:predicted RNA binding protein YcfA (HicA-like mRNA interferase family)